MSNSENQHKRKSALITLLLMLLLLVMMFNCGMTYFDPPVEYGVAINFGDSSQGSGDPQEENQSSQEITEEIEQQEIQEEFEDKQETKQEEVVEELKAVQETVSEKVITNQETKSLPLNNAKDTPKENKIVEKKEEPKKDVPKVVKPEKKVVKSQPAKPKIVKKAKKPSKSTTDALQSLLKGKTKKGANSGEGDDKKKGVKGSKEGDPKSSKYYGGGQGSGGNYQLAGRKALSKPIRKPGCQESGTVVVIIYVNNSGVVTRAMPGGRGTTNSAPCLFEAAAKAAKATKWNPDPEAPQIQKGKIIYKFSLTQ